MLVSGKGESLPVGLVENSTTVQFLISSLLIEALVSNFHHHRFPIVHIMLTLLHNQNGYYKCRNRCLPVDIQHPHSSLVTHY